MRLSVCCVLVIFLYTVFGNDKLTSRNKKKVVQRNTTNPVISTGTTIIVPTRAPLLSGVRLPCACAEGQCGCCTGVILEWIRQKACLNITYEPDDFSLTTALSMNGNTLYKNSVSGKNPPPMCMRLPRIPFIRFCVKFSNIYFASRNVHVCVDMEANWEEITLVEWSFECMRLGTGGFAVLGPEEGGGISIKPIDAVDQTDEDYDDSARYIPLKRNKFLNIWFDKTLTQINNTTIDKSLVKIIRTKDNNIKITYNNHNNKLV